MISYRCRNVGHRRDPERFSFFSTRRTFRVESPRRLRASLFTLVLPTFTTSTLLLTVLIISIRLVSSLRFLYRFRQVLFIFLSLLIFSFLSLAMSGRRESDPRYMLGRRVHYHCATSAWSCQRSKATESNYTGTMFGILSLLTLPLSGSARNRT